MNSLECFSSIKSRSESEWRAAAESRLCGLLVGDYLSEIVNIIRANSFLSPVIAVSHVAHEATAKILTSCCVVSTDVSEHINRAQREPVAQQTAIRTPDLPGSLAYCLYLKALSSGLLLLVFFFCLVHFDSSVLQKMWSESFDWALCCTVGRTLYGFIHMAPIHYGGAHCLLSLTHAPSPMGKPTFSAEAELVVYVGECNHLQTLRSVGHNIYYVFDRPQFPGWYLAARGAKYELHGF